MVSLFTLFRDTNMDKVYTAARALLSAGQPPEGRMKAASWGPSGMMNVSPVMIQIWTALARARIRAPEMQHHLKRNFRAQVPTSFLPARAAEIQAASGTRLAAEWHAAKAQACQAYPFSEGEKLHTPTVPEPSRFAMPKRGTNVSQNESTV